MAKPLSKTKIVGHLAEKVGTPKKTVHMVFDELFKTVMKEAEGAAGKFSPPDVVRLLKAHRKGRIGRNPNTGKGSSRSRNAPSALARVYWF